MMPFRAPSRFFAVICNLLIFHNLAVKTSRFFAVRNPLKIITSWSCSLTPHTPYRVSTLFEEGCHPLQIDKKPEFNFEALALAYGRNVSPATSEAFEG